jgi:AcrR family transcriptional regulator
MSRAAPRGPADGPAEEDEDVAAEPTTGRGRASRRRIVDAARDLFHRQGVAATGLNEVIVASGTGKGQLYHYFEDKPDLVLAVVAAQTESTLRAQRELVEGMADADDLRAWVEQAVAVHGSGGPVRCPLGSLVVELTDAHPRLRDALTTAFDRWRDALAEGLERLQRNGHVRVDRTPGDLAEILLCAYEGGVVLSEVRRTTAPLRLALTAAVESMLR